MASVARVIRRARLLLTRRAFERDLDEEMRFHMDMAAERHAAAGGASADVRLLLHKEFGAMARYKEEVRDAHGMTTLDDWWRTIRFAFRTLIRTPAFTIVALITFALGIGANTAIFSVVNAVLLRPLDYANAERLVRVYESSQDHFERGSASYMNFLDWKKQSTTMDSLGAYSVSAGLLDATGDGEPARMREALVTGSVLPMLGVRPALGRWFNAEEETQGRQHVVILSDNLWRTRYAANPRILGQTINIESTPYTVVGVMPRGFNFPAGARVTDMWAPFVPPEQALDPRSRGWHWLGVVGLLKPGVSVQQADREMHSIAQRIQALDPVDQANRTATAMSMQQALVGDIRPVLMVLLGAVSLVLLIACANVANLLLARNAARKKDVAVRIALGATRGQLARQFLTESVVLALLGAFLGLGVARLALRMLSLGSVPTLPVSGSIPLDWRVLVALLGAAVLCGIAFGVAPAFQLSSQSVRGGLSDLTVKTTSGTEMKRYRSGLVVAQIALSLMLLIGAGLLMRGYVALQNTDPGLSADHVLTARLAVPRRLRAPAGVEQTALLRPLLERVRAIPGVRAAGLTSLLPIDQSGSTASFWIDNKPWPASGNQPLIEVRSVSPGFIGAMGVRLIAGRDFTEADDSSSALKVIVNQAVVRRLMPNENPLGRRLRQGSAERYRDYEIIGVMGDVKQAGLDVPANPEAYTSYADPRIDWTGGDMTIVVKTAVPETSVLPALRDALKGVARDVALFDVRPMDEVVERSLSSRRLTMMLFAIFAAVALALAASGLYGLIYYLVTQRTREIGIRVALGARPSRILGMVVGQSAALVGFGIALGLAAALLFTKWLSRMLYGVGAHDPVTFAAVPLVLAIVGLLASAVPAWRASRVDAVVALREE